MWRRARRAGAGRSPGQPGNRVAGPPQWGAPMRRAALDALPNAVKFKSWTAKCPLARVMQIAQRTKPGGQRWNF